MDVEKKACRVCMSSVVTLMELFVEPILMLSKEPSLAEMLTECVGCEVKPDDPLPKMICLTCVIETKNAYRFKRKCEQSHKSFWEMHNKQKQLIAAQSQVVEHPIDTSPIKVEVPETGEVKRPNGKTLTISSIRSINTSADHIDDESHDKGLSVRSLLSDTHKTITLKEVVQTFKCIHCPRAFNERLALQTHLRSHGVTPYKCRHCPKSFAHHEELDEHLHHTHYVELRFECAKCLKLFSTEENLKLHSRSHAPARRSYECPHCLKPFGQLPSLQKHMRIHSPYKCPYCPMSFAHKHMLAYHILVHTGERPHKCPHCDKAFKKKQHVEYHLLTHRGEGVL
ncbi:zinc finger protein 570-like [Drosophila nasuta]|uniref:zinc finger protein 570-like n=1 Tax=Drosophila nasuta TaxID=42062 RepID=UPI00295E2D6A|nr:zinc finger protein 570-like [Drosophila nasuta]